MKKILIVFGTRPEAIKMAPVVHEFLRFPEHFDTKVCVTAQHREMLDQVLRIFNIIPDFDLDLMKPNQDLFDITSRVLMDIRKVLQEVNPDLVFVHGDTTTSMAVTLAGFYLRIPVAHVEAGLRTYDLQSPWPEEMNRQVTDKITTFFLAPTLSSRKNLINEGIPEGKICVTGNTVIDSLQYMVEKINLDPDLKILLSKDLVSAGYDPDSRGFIDKTRKMILVTGHRRENFGSGFIDICNALKDIALKYPSCDIVYPVHLNPNVREPVNNILTGTKNIFLIEPLDYAPFVMLMQRSYLILTDSGGIQEEAPSLGKPVLVMRDTTERPEAVESGTVKLVGTDPNKIIYETEILLTRKNAYEAMSMAYNPYGDGKAASRIVEFIKQKLYDKL